MSLKHNDASKRKLYLMVSWKTPVSGNILHEEATSTHYRGSFNSLQILIPSCAFNSFKIVSNNCIGGIN